MNREAIAARIPHQGRMCLLDQVQDFDADELRCSSLTHRDPEHPLRARDRLGAACALEYAGQAVALHAALTAPEAQRATGGAIVAVREMTLGVSRLDDLPDALLVHCRRLDGDTQTLIYAFEVSSGPTAVASGRMTVMTRAPGEARSS
jgi:predicted hotdog family 3-hydroxylacyl-ACP dehydratase